mgnify:CR=1 FL=1
MIPFSKATYVGNELKYIEEAVLSRNISGDGTFTKKGNEWFHKKFDVNTPVSVESMGGHLFAFDTANLRQPFRAAMVCPVINCCEKEDYERK